MAEATELQLTIDMRLRFTLFGLECALGVSFDGGECERVFRDAAEDQVTVKCYTFFTSPRLSVTGRVDEYEPESVWLRAEGKRGIGEVLRKSVGGAGLHVFRLTESMERESQNGPIPGSG